MNRTRGTHERRPGGSAAASFEGSTSSRKGASPDGVWRARSLALAFVGLTLLGIGLALLGDSFLEGAKGEGIKGVGAKEPGPVNTKYRVPSGPENQASENRASSRPRDGTLRLTIPEMARIRRDAVPYAAAGDEGALRRSAAMHLRGTGFPWQRGANVYLAGHRLGYPKTESWLTFWDLDGLERGDKAFLFDASGRRYAYRVYKVFVVDPDGSWVTKPVPGKSVLTLQTCTLPDYSKRLIVRAELVGEREENAPGRDR